MTEPPYRDDCSACVVKRFWLDTLRFCGCGIQGPTLGVFRDVMQTMSDAVEQKTELSWNEAYEARKKLFADNTAWEYLVYYTLDAHDLTEHGGSVPGWLSAAGEHILSAMAGKSDDELDDMLDHEHET
jgi:hypothetical protein